MLTIVLLPNKINESFHLVVPQRLSVHILSPEDVRMISAVFSIEELIATLS